MFSGEFIMNSEILQGLHMYEDIICIQGMPVAMAPRESLKVVVPLVKFIKYSVHVEFTSSQLISMQT